MSYDQMTYEQIVEDIAQRCESIRLSKGIKQSEIEEKTGLDRQIINRFIKRKGDIKFSNFIKLLKGLGELDRLEKLLEVKTMYRPSLVVEKHIPKRVRDKKKGNETFTWGDD